MRARQALAALFASAVALGFSTTSIARAADLGTVTWNGTSFSPTSLTGTTSDTFRINVIGGPGVEIRGPVNLVAGGGGTTSCMRTSACLIASGSGANFSVQSPGNVEAYEVGFLKATLTISAGGGSGSGSSGASASPPPVYSVTFTSNATCAVSSVSADSGSWVQLPKASQCTPLASNAGATLLGWSTIANFPVAIAQRQVDRGWGAYEMFDAQGALTGVFIPAGGYALLSASTTLIPVWSK